MADHSGNPDSARPLFDRFSAGRAEGLGQSSRRGPAWGVATDGLNATVLEWPPHTRLPAHVNGERDVILAVLAGTVAIEIDSEPVTARAGDVVVIRKGASRSIHAGPEGVRYLTVHRRREGLEIAPAPAGVRPAERS